MYNYFEELNPKLKEYFNILSDDIPYFLNEYINTPEMQKQAMISVSCGTYYSKMFNIDMWYSSLDHSVAVALIIWNFTKDKKQTLSGLFHDIATPAFKHCIDFMNGDYENQESTEELTSKIIRDSKKIMNLLNRDGIKLEEVYDYHMYPIADNDTPQLSSDRLEYTFSNALGARTVLWNLDEIKEIYNDIEIQENENGIQELGFRTKEIAEKFVSGMSTLSSLYINNKTKFAMQFLADIMRYMNEENLITVDELYKLSEKEVIEKIENCNYKNIADNFNIWKKSNDILESDEKVDNKYCVGVKAKLRYIVPLVRDKDSYIRINQISNNAKKDIEKCVNYKTKKFAYLDFKFK